MKLPIKKEYFDRIKSGEKNFELRDAHITFICEETGETLKKQVANVKLVQNDGIYSDCCKDQILIEFELEKKRWSW